MMSIYSSVVSDTVFIFQGGIGAVLREVPISENSRQGALLKAFYEKNGIKNGDSYDVQLVE